MNRYLTDINMRYLFWPQIMKSEGQIYYAGTYADNLSIWMKSYLRQAQRVSQEIDEI